MVRLKQYFAAGWILLIAAVSIGASEAQASLSRLIQLVRQPHIQYILLETEAGRDALWAIHPGSSYSAKSTWLPSLLEGLEANRIRDTRFARELTSRLEAVDGRYRRHAATGVDRQQLLRALALEEVRARLALGRTWFGGQRLRFAPEPADSRFSGIVSRFLSGERVYEIGPTLNRRIQLLEGYVGNLNDRYFLPAIEASWSIEVIGRFGFRYSAVVRFLDDIHRAARWELAMTGDAAALDRVNTSREVVARMIADLRHDGAGLLLDRYLDETLMLVRMRDAR